MGQKVVSVALQDGFEGDHVIVRINGEAVLDAPNVRTDQRIGLASAVDVAVGEDASELVVEVPDRGLHAIRQIDDEAPPFLGVSLLNGQLVLTTSNTPFGYA